MIVSKDKKATLVGTLVFVFFLSSLTLTNPGKALAVDAFLKIDGVDGESTDAKHRGEINVINWSFGESQSGAGTRSTGVPRTAERANFQDFKFTMRTNKASPKLFQNCAEGKHLKEALLTVRRAGKEQQDFLQVWLSEVMVSSFVNLGSSGTTTEPVEEIMLNFAKIKISYKPQKADGTLGSPEVAGWDLTSNKPSH